MKATRSSILDVYLTKNKNRISARDNVVFMDNGETFQIQLSNNSPEYLCLQFIWNGKSQVNQLVLRPYQHTFIDRFIDAQSKLTFKTYQTTASPAETKDLGALKILAYRGQFKKEVPYTITWTNTNFGYPTTFITGSCLNNCGTAYNTLNNVTLTATAGNTISSRSSRVLYNKSVQPASKSKSLNLNVAETGLVERGQRSNTQFSQLDIRNTYVKLAEVQYKILPMSQKQLYTTSDIKVYCSNCGRRRRQKQNFCPACGSKF